MFKVTTHHLPSNPTKATIAGNPVEFRGKNLKRLLMRLLGTVLLLGLLWRLNLNWLEVIVDLSRANLLPVLVALALIFPIVSLKAWRWKFILSNYQIKLSLKDITALYGLGLSAGSITPGQAGEFVKAFSLQDKGFSFGKSLISILLDRLFDVFVLLLLVLYGLSLLGSNFYNQLPLLLLLLSLAGSGIIILVIPSFYNFFFNRLLGKILTRKFISAKGGIRAELAQENQSSRIQVLSLKTIGCSLFFTLITAGFAIARTWLLAQAIGVNFTPSTALTVSSLATIASLVPVSISGIGTRDVALVGVMAQLGYANDIAISLSTLLLLLNLFNLVAGYAIWFILKPMKGALKSELAGL